MIRRMDDVFAYVESHRQRLVEELCSRGATRSLIRRAQCFSAFSFSAFASLMILSAMKAGTSS